MTIPALALLTRALREDVRLLRMHAVRLVLALFLLAALIAAHVNSTLFGAPGLNFFQSIAWVNFALITLAGFGYFATGVTEEKEEQTLGLLKMAGIGATGLLLGKSTSRLLTTTLILAAQLPFTLLAVTLGGVMLSQVLAAYLGLLAYMVLVANLGLLCSVTGRTSAEASAWTLAALTVFLGVVPLASLTLAATGTTPPAAVGALLDTLRAASVAERLEVILSTGFNESAWSFQVWSNLAAAASLFAAAWLAFERFTRESAPLAERIVVRATRGRRRRPRRVWGDPLVWKEFHVGTGGWWGIGLRLVLCVLAVVAVHAGVTSSGRPATAWRLGNYGASIMSGLLVVIAADLALQAARIFRWELRDRTLPTLVLLPRSLAGITASKGAGSALPVIPAVVLFVAAALALDHSAATFRFEYMNRGTWLMVVQFAVLLMTTLRLSLSVRWGALPLALGIVYVVFPAAGSLLIMPFVGRAGGILEGIRVWELVFAPLDLVGAVVIVLLWHSTLRRLERAAAE